MLVDPAEVKSAQCSVCAGSGWAFVEGKGVRPCECRSSARIDELLSSSRIPKRYDACTFGNFSPYNYSLKRSVKLSMEFVQQYPLVDAGLLFVGSCGVGKTHLAVAVLRELIISKGAVGLFYDFRDLLKEIQDSYNPNTHTSELAILAPVFEAEILVLDELGAAKPTEWVRETMTHIINKRYNDKKVTIFTTNYLENPSESAYDETLTERVGVRLRSRLYEMCQEIVFPGVQDYREKVNNPNLRLSSV